MILYGLMLLICIAGAYVMGYVVPKLKAKVIDDIKVLYQNKDFENAIERCNAYLEKYPHEPEGYIWLGRCYDGIAIMADEQIKLRERYLKNAQNPYYAEAEQKAFAAKAEKIAEYLTRWREKNYAVEAKTQYQKALGLSPGWHTGIEILESYIYGKRLDDAERLIQSISPPDSKEDRAYHELMKMDLYAQLAIRKEIDTDTFAAQCQKTMELYLPLPETEISENLQRNRALPYIYLAKINIEKQDFIQAHKYYQAASTIVEKFIVQKKIKRTDNYLDLASDMYLAWGLMLEKQGDLINAERILTKAVALSPTWATALYELARVEAELCNLSAAFQNLNESLYCELENAELPVYHRVFQDEIWKKCRNHPDFQMIMGYPDEYSIPVQIRQDLRKAIYYALNFRTLNVRFNSITWHCDNILNRDAECYPAHLLILYCMLVQKHYKLSWDGYFAEEQAKLDNNALSEIEKEKLEKARQILKEQGLDQFDLNKCEENIRISIAAARKISPSPQAEINIAYCYFKASLFQDDQKGFSFFPEVIELLAAALPNLTSPQSQSIACYLKGTSHLRLNQEEEAIAELARAANLSPDQPFYQLGYAGALAKAGQLDRAVTEYGKVVADRNVPFLNYQVGRELLNFERWIEARKYFETCVALCPNNDVAWYGIAKTYLLEGNGQQAVAMLENAYKNQGNVALLNRLWREDSAWEKIEDPQLRQDLIRILRKYSSQ